MNEISDNIIAIDIFLYLKKHKTFVISDIHAGYEESLHKQGALLPKSGQQELMLRLEKAFDILSKKNMVIENIIINGDLVHSFSKFSKDEKAVIKNIIKFLKSYAMVTIIKGNHDKLLQYLVGENVDLKKNILIGDVLITHGDMIDDDADLKGVSTIIIGHEHPSIALKSGVRIEKYKCFLKGKFKKKILIVMPSANLLVEGSDILKEKLMSPYLNDISKFEVFAVGDQIFEFGKVKDVIRL